MTRVIFGLLFVLVLSMSVTQSIQASGYSFVGVTSNGVEFPIENYYTTNIGIGNGTGNGTATVNGMGINSVIVQEEFDGRLTFGADEEGVDVSLIPYLLVNSDTEFVALVETGDTEIIYQIPVLGEEYELQGNNLYKISPNLLIYSNNTTPFGTNTISTNDNYITITGNGVTILEIDGSHWGEEMYLDGVSSGVLKLVTSDYNIIDDAEFLYEFSNLNQTDNGYEVGTLNCSSLGDQNTTIETHTWVYDAGIWVWTITSNLSKHDNTISCLTVSPMPISSTNNVYGQMEIDVLQRSLSTWCDNFYPGGVCHYDYSNEFTETRTISSTQNDIPNILSMELITSNSGEDIILDEIKYVGKYIFENACRSCINYIPSHTVYEILLPVYDMGVDYDIEEEFSEAFNTNVTFPNEKSYLMVKPDGGTVSIRGTGSEDTDNSLIITNLPENIPYQILKNSQVIGTGVTSSAGVINIEELNVEEGEQTAGGYLHLFPDSLSYRGDFSTVILDNVNDESIHIESEDDLVYVVHAYALIPTVGDVTVSDLYLSNDEDTLPLDYLNKEYTNSEDILVPIIPKYKIINFMVNDIFVSLPYGNILGGTGIKIIEPSTSIVDFVNYSSRIRSAESTVGTTSYVIATTDGTVNAIVTETISGSVYIENTYYLEATPPPPPVPVRRDPLSGWVDIMINGEFVESLSLGVNPYPDFTTSGTQSGTTVIQSVSYSYPDYVVSGAISIDVESGDFVEFYLYAKIHGDIDNYSAPSGFTVIGEKGTSTAIVYISNGSIITSE